MAVVSRRLKTEWPATGPSAGNSFLIPSFHSPSSLARSFLRLLLPASALTWTLEHLRFGDTASFLCFKLFIYLFVAVLGLRYSAGSSLVAENGGFSLYWLLFLQRTSSTASVVATRGLVAPWQVGSPRSGTEPVSPALAGRFFTTDHRRASHHFFRSRVTFHPFSANFRTRSDIFVLPFIFRVAIATHHKDDCSGSE